MGSVSERITAISVFAAVLLLALVPTVSAEGDVAVIGEESYATLAEAVSAAVDGDVILLVSDTEETECIGIDKNLTIDGQGHNFGGTLVIDSFVCGELYEYRVLLENIVFTSLDGSAIRSEKPETEEDTDGEDTEETPDEQDDGEITILALNLEIAGCTFASSVEAIDCELLSVTDCTFSVTDDYAPAVILGQIPASDDTEAGVISSASISGCSFSSPIEVFNCNLLSVTDCTFSVTGDYGISAVISGTASSVSVKDCTFSGSYAQAAVILGQMPASDDKEAGVISSASISGCTFVSYGTDIKLGLGSEYSSSFPVSVSAMSDTETIIDSGRNVLMLALSPGATLSISDVSEYIIKGTSVLSGSVGDSVSLYAAGTVTVADFAGTVWFDASEFYGITVATDASENITVNTSGMTVSGNTGTSDVIFKGNFMVSNDDLKIGNTLTVSEDSSLTIGSGGRVSDGRIENRGTVEVYGTLTSDINNMGILYIHAKSLISGEITGYTPITPVPATIITVVYATVGKLFEMILSPEEGTAITEKEIPPWMTLTDGVLSGTPEIEGEFDAEITAESDEYTVTYYYRIIVNPAPDSEDNDSEDNTAILILLAILIAVIAAIALRAVGII